MRYETCWFLTSRKNKQNSDKIKYQTFRMRSCVNHGIEVNQKMLILKGFITKNDFLCDDDN